MSCGFCINCQTRMRWEAIYKKFIKDYPSKENEEFINRQRKIDSQLICFHPQEVLSKAEIIRNQEAEMRSNCYEEVL